MREGELKMIIFSIVAALLQSNNVYPASGSNHTSPSTCSYITYITNYNEGWNTLNYTAIKCVQNNICEKTFNVTFIEMFPHYYPGYLSSIYDMFAKCCGNCVKYNTHNTLRNISALKEEDVQTSDFVYPVFASADTRRLYGSYYLPVDPIPYVYYITKNNDSVFHGILSIWPVLFIAILMAIIAGFVGWLLETWQNEEEFHRPFHVGWFDGFWWSFVSMTTVGYGTYEVYFTWHPYIRNVGNRYLRKMRDWV